MKSSTQNAISYCKAAFDAGSFSVAENSTPILLSGYGYPDPKPEGFNRRMAGIYADTK